MLGQTWIGLCMGSLLWCVVSDSLGNPLVVWLGAEGGGRGKASLGLRASRAGEVDASREQGERAAHLVCGHRRGAWNESHYSLGSYPSHCP